MSYGNISVWRLRDNKEPSSQGSGVTGGAVPSEMNLNEWTRKQVTFLSKTMSWSLSIWICGRECQSEGGRDKYIKNELKA